MIDQPPAELRLYIDGAFRPAADGRTFADIDPATGAELSRIHEAGPADVDAAVAAARRAFPGWAATPAAERGRILMRAAEILRARNPQIARIEVLDTGKPIAEAEAVDVLSGADCLAYFAGVAATLHGQHVDLPPTAFAYTRREPLGVCVGIGAWNYPIQIACWKAAPALACGNTMVFKPSELTPLTAAILAEVFTEAGLPPGVFNVVQGARETGQALARHPDVDKISVTGSVPTGKAVMADAAGTLKHVTMELGGKSPLIVFADADLDNAVSAALLANFYTQGEICSNGTRVFVHRDAFDGFVERLLPRVDAMRIGDPLDPSTHVGSLISMAHRDKVEGYIAAGVAAGAKLHGGQRPSAPELAGGAFLRPAVFTGCTDDMSIVREEIFGPVMCILPFDDEAEVIERANATPFGLAAGLFTRDLARGHRVAAALQAGICWINTYNITPIEVPFGGVKQSGIGRENGLAAIEHYTQLKTVYVELGDVDAPY